MRLVELINVIAPEQLIKVVSYNNKYDLDDRMRKKHIALQDFSDYELNADVENVLSLYLDKLDVEVIYIYIV